MKKLRILFLIALSSTLIFTACGKSKEEPAPTDETVEEDDTPTISVVPEEAAPEEELKDGMVRSTLTNEWIDESLEKQRPISVMINNVTAALPQSDISKADIMYECTVEGGITRLMAVFKDWQGLEKIGPVRSSRFYYIYWSTEWDAIYCHFGGPEVYVKQHLAKDFVDNLDGTTLDGSVYYRSTDRKAPHNAYVSGAGVLKGLDKFDYSLDYTKNYEGAHYKFTSESKPVELSSKQGAKSAKRVDLPYTVNKPYFEYNESDGLYYRFQYGGKHIDQETGEQLTFKNIIVQNTQHVVLDAKGYLGFTDHDTTMDGYYFTDGQAIHITWKKTGDMQPTSYYDDNGQEIILNTGKTFVAIVQDDMAKQTKFK